MALGGSHGEMYYCEDAAIFPTCLWKLQRKSRGCSYPQHTRGYSSTTKMDICVPHLGQTAGAKAAAKT